MGEEFAAILKQMQEQQHRDNMSMQTLISQLFSGGNPTASQPSSKDSSPEFIIEALASNISEFCHDVDNNLTFDTWYTRYEDLFEIDAAKLDDAAKTRLLLRKLNTVVHSKYINYILPKHPRDFSFSDTVAKLKQLFGTQTSQFNLRFNCLQLTKEASMDYITYAGIVNKQCELFKLKDMTLDQFKCLIFVMGLKSPSDFEARVKMLNKLDSESATLTINALTTDCQRLLNLKADTILIENQKETHVNRLHTKNLKTKETLKTPKTPCWFCGAMHYARDCQYKNHKCEQCKVIGHKEGYCYARRKSNRSAKLSKQKYNSKKPHHHSPTRTAVTKGVFVQKGVFLTKDVSGTNKIDISQRKYVTVKINETTMRLQFDTASDITIISEQNFKKIQVPATSNVDHTARSATGKLPLSARFECKVKFKDKQELLTCYVTPIQDLNIMGLDWIREFKLDDMPINAICNQVKEDQGSIENFFKISASKLKSSFPDLFDGKLGRCNKTKAVLLTKPDIQPVFKTKRSVAYAMQQLVEEELKRLQDSNVISPVNYSDWAAPIVVIKKANGNVRICADFSTGLNNCLETHQYPLPLPEDIFSKLANAKYFSHIDLSDAFLQIEVDEASRHLLTINTHMGLFRYNRMVFGIKTFPAIFQQIMDQMLAGLPGAAAYIDDIFVSGKNEEEHARNLHEVLQRIQDYGFKLKYEKCVFFKTEVRYLGYIINQHGLRPDPDRITAINTMPEPTNVSELRSFLGAINFYGKFIDKMRHHRGPLDNLLKSSVPWKWTKTHQKCFQNLKQVLSSDLLLAHYDPTQNIVVAADASMYGLGACIMHKYSDGTIKAISHASRSLTAAEQGYSQIEKEGLALIFAVTKFHKMIFGRKFELHTDHKPLLAIFGRKTGIAVHQANRLQRWAVKLLAYDFQISFISTTSFGYADVLSRLINKEAGVPEDYVIAAIKMEKNVNKIVSDVINNLPVTHKMIKFESAKDKTLKPIFDYVLRGWPKSIHNNDELETLFHRKGDISVVDGCILVGERIVIPRIYRKRILKQLHRGHPGIERTKAIARSFVYWPHIDYEIKSFIQNCNSCALAAKMPVKTKLQPWPAPQVQWERLHIDYAGPIDGYYFLVVVDAYSKWPEIVETKSITAQQTVSILSEIFARFGLPKTIVSDNGTQFKSAQFEEFLEQNGIQHLCSSPYYPMSNGQAERFVDTLKRALKKLQGEGTTVQNLHTFLQTYRSTPSANTPDNKSPAEIMFGRRIRVSLDLLRPPSTNINEESLKKSKMETHFNRKHGAKQRDFQHSDNVYSNVPDGNNNFKWIPGKVIERRGKVMYNVLLENGKLIRSHVNQLRRRYNDRPTMSGENRSWNTVLGLYESHPTVPDSGSRIEDADTFRPDSSSFSQPQPVLRRSQRTRKPVIKFVPG